MFLIHHYILLISSNITVVSDIIINNDILVGFSFLSASLAMFIAIRKSLGSSSS